MRNNLNYDILAVQPQEYVAGELEWKYDFEIVIEIDVSMIRAYVLFISLTVDNDTREFQKIPEFCNLFSDKLIESQVPYAFEECSETYEISISYDIVRDSIREYRQVSGDVSLIRAGESFVERLAKSYEQEVGLSPEERIPGPIVPSTNNSLCSVCESPLAVHGVSDHEDQMFCVSCDEFRNDPKSWEWRSPEPDPEYDGSRPDEQPDIDEAACPNCGTLLSNVKDETIGHCINCRGIWHKGTWHLYEHIPRDEIACPDCGSRFSDPIGDTTAFCELCDEFYQRREWVEYDPMQKIGEYPYEVEPGVVQLGERKYRVEKTGHIVDSKWEADIDQRLAERVSEHQREPEKFEIEGGHYIPDFRVKDIIIEVKGIQHEDMLDSAVQKANSFRRRNPELTYVIIGDEDSKKIPCDKWFNYQSNRLEAVSWVQERMN